jgi:hypothetical protein
MINKIKSFRFTVKQQNILILFILALWAIFRLVSYGDIRLSIAGNDTPTFVEASRVPLFSAEMMTGRRLLTTNLIYKILEPKEGYQILVNGSLGTSRRELQPGFDRIVVLQLMLSILGWSALTWAIAYYLKNFVAKILTALIIPAFAYTPQVADWDSILMSESMTFSLFALQLAILIFIVFSLHQDPKAKVTPYLILWGVVYFLWANLRDTNNYVALILFALIGLTLFTPPFKKHKTLIALMFFTMSIFILGIVTFRQSGRSAISTINIYQSDIFPHQTRVDYMTKIGMPNPQTAEFPAWLEEHGTTGIVRFIFAHPGYAIEKLARDFPEAFKEIQQTYFKTPEMRLWRERLIDIGEGLHPENSSPFLVSLIVLIGIITAAIKNKTPSSAGWAWLCTYLILAGTITIIPTILGDTWALNRHALLSTIIYRLSMWLFVIVTIDLALTDENQTQKIIAS